MSSCNPNNLFVKADFDMIEAEKVNAGGKLLRIKIGFNPNSSSVGSQIPMFYAFALGSGALTVLVLNLINHYDRLLGSRWGKSKNDRDSAA